MVLLRKRGGYTPIQSISQTVWIGDEAIADAEDSLRFINLTIRRINNMLVIKVKNGCSVAPTVADGDLRTSKTDKVLHGWGLKSVRTAAEHYDGKIETEYNNQTFRSVVTLSFRTICQGHNERY